MRKNFTFLTFIAMMQSIVFSLFTQERSVAFSARFKHFLNSWSDLTHHLTFSPGVAKTVAVNEDI